MLLDDNTAQQTYELYGPTEYSMHDIYDIAAKEVLKRRPLINIPKTLRKPASSLFSKLIWWVQTNPDLIEREFIDQHIDPTAKTFADLNIEPVEMKACTYEYLQGCVFVCLFTTYFANIALQIPQ